MECTEDVWTCLRQREKVKCVSLCADYTAETCRLIVAHAMIRSAVYQQKYTEKHTLMASGRELACGSPSRSVTSSLLKHMHTFLLSSVHLCLPSLFFLHFPTTSSGLPSSSLDTVRIWTSPSDWLEIIITTSSRKFHQLILFPLPGNVLL